MFKKIGPQLKHFSLTTGYIPDIVLLHLPICIHLEELCLAGNFYHPNASPIAKLQNLKVLKIRSRLISNLIDIFLTNDNLKNLVELELSVNNNIDPNLLKIISSKCPNLVSFTLQVKQDKLCGLFEISHMKKLKKLHLINCNIDPKDLICLFNSGNLEHLMELQLFYFFRIKDFTKNPWTVTEKHIQLDQVIQSIALGCPQLESLELNANDMKKPTISEIQNLKKLKFSIESQSSLISEIRNSEMSISLPSEDLLSIFSNGKLKHLEHLDFGETNTISDEVIKAIAKECPKLQCLNLANFNKTSVKSVEISEKTIEYLLKMCKNLRELHLNESYSILYLVWLKRYVPRIYFGEELISHKTITRLNIGENSIDYIDALTQLHNLKTLIFLKLKTENVKFVLSSGNVNWKILQTLIFKKCDKIDMDVTKIIALKSPNFQVFDTPEGRTYSNVITN